MRFATCIGIVCLPLLVISPARAADWPQFRGPGGLGHTEEKDLPVEWGGEDDRNVLWQADLTGQGHASPIVFKGGVFTCTVHWPGDKPDAKVMPRHLVSCYRAADGARRWQTEIEPGPWLRSDFRSGAGGGYAAPTPCTDGEHVFILFGSSVLASLDFDGHIAWRKEIHPHTFDVTIGASPVLYKDTIIIHCAMAKKDDSRLVAFDKRSGEIKWQTPTPGVGFAHSTPLLIDVNGKTQVITLASGMATKRDALQAFDADTGERLWWCRGAGDASSPIYSPRHKLVYFDSGRGSPGVAVGVTGEGDVGESHVKWEIAQVPTAICSPIVVGDYIYRLHEPNTLKCWRAADGEMVYRARLEGITSTWASPIADGNGRLYFVSGGTSVVVQSGPQFKVLAVNKLNDANHASAAVADGRWFIVGMKQLHCIGAKR